MKTILTIPTQSRLVIDEYNSLNIEGHKVVAPYFMNIRKQRGGLRVLVGKGDPGEIEREVKVWAQLKGIDLTKMTPVQIRDFMITQNIGIDCSGFVVHVLNYWLRSQGDKPLINYLMFKKQKLIDKLKHKLRPVESIGANFLTNQDNCITITDLNKVLPGDFVRLKGLQKNSHHILLIHQVVKEDKQVKQIEYVHSTSHFGKDCGIRYGKINIIDIKKPLEEQEWTETVDDKNWTYQGYINQLEDNGIRRLKNIKLKFSKLQID